MDDASIKHMVDRFLQWKLPKTFSPDNGISFNPVGNPDTDHTYTREPVGTNLLDYTQATEMVRFMVEGLDTHSTTIVNTLPCLDYIFQLSKQVTLKYGIKVSNHEDDCEISRDLANRLEMVPCHQREIVTKKDAGI